MPSKSIPQVTSGDYLHGFLLGTRSALFDNDRESITITVPRVDARTVGALIALFERAVGFYASLIGINAYHQPGVEAGKKAAAVVLELQRRILDALGPKNQTAEALAAVGRVRPGGNHLSAPGTPGGQRACRNAMSRGSTGFGVVLAKKPASGA